MILPFLTSNLLMQVLIKIENRLENSKKKDLVKKPLSYLQIVYGVVGPHGSSEMRFLKKIFEKVSNMILINITQ